MGYAMGDGRCADCETIQQAALDATVRHFHAESRLAIAKMRHDTSKRRVLRPLVESLLQVRIAAVRAYQEHVDTHAEEVESSLTKNLTEK